MDKMHVVVGACGALGSAIVRRLVSEGRPVRALVHDTEKAAAILPPEAEVMAGGAMSVESIHLACREAGTVYHCVNVPYHRWDEVMPFATENILAGARAVEAVLVFPGNVYGYGAFSGAATEDHPHDAATHKGQLRNRLEKRLTLADRSGECRVVIPRFPDFYGPGVTNKAFGAIFEGAVTGKKVHWLGHLDVPHSLVYVEDAAAAAILLADRSDAHGQVWHVPGPGPLTGREFLRIALTVAGSHADIGAWTRANLVLAGLFDAEAREAIELLYLFEEPMVLDGAKFSGAFPDFHYTPHDVAVRRTVEWFRRHADMEDEWRLLPEPGHVAHA